MNKEFSIPYYIFEEVIEYIEQTKNGKCKTMKWENIKALLYLAKINNKLSEQQVDFLIKKYNRENRN